MNIFLIIGQLGTAPPNIAPFSSPSGLDLEVKSSESKTLRKPPVSAWAPSSILAWLTHKSSGDYC